MTRFGYIVSISLGLGACIACGGDSFVASNGNTLGGGEGGMATGGAGGGVDGGSGGTSGSAGTQTGGDGGSGGSGATSTGGTRGGTGGTAGGGTTGGSGGIATGGASGATGGSGGSTSSTKQYAHNYDQSCDYDGECKIVIEGDACGCVGCEDAAVSYEAYEQYLADWNSIDCPTVGEPIPCPAALCLEVVAACSDGTCTTRQPVYIEASQFDRACFEDSDCHLIYQGEICSACQCVGAAVNTGGFAEYQEIVAAASCNPGPSVCDCAAIGEPRCQREGDAGMGQCVLGF